MNPRVRETKRPPYWLIVRQSYVPPEVLRIRLAGGKETLPIFSFREEAGMFLQLQGLQEGWQARQTTPGELRSLFYTILRGVERVTLDPIPEISCMDNSRLLGVCREDFLAPLETLEKANGGGELLDKRATRPAVLDERRPMQKLG
ncbi:MAG: hypothetical protein WA990_05440 [Rubrobacteraceae bacterium]